MPDVTWIPVDETPCGQWARFVSVEDEEDWLPIVKLGWPRFPEGNLWWVDENGTKIEGVTHYAEITYPEPPEEA